MLCSLTCAATQLSFGLNFLLFCLQLCAIPSVSLCVASSGSLPLLRLLRGLLLALRDTGRYISDSEARALSIAGLSRSTQFFVVRAGYPCRRRAEPRLSSYRTIAGDFRNSQSYMAEGSFIQPSQIRRDGRILFLTV